MSPCLGTLGAADDRRAIVEPGRGHVTYAELDALVDRIAARLRALGLVAGDRVGLLLGRSIDLVAAMYGVLRAGGVYVPADPGAPVARSVGQHIDCGVKIAIVEQGLADAYRRELAARQVELDVQVVEPVGLGRTIAAWAGTAHAIAPAVNTELAFIFYTSGTRGHPKGVMLSRRAIDVYVAWTLDFVRPTRSDVFANHAQMNFSISVFEVHTSLAAGSTLVIVPEEARPNAASVAKIIEAERVSIWFSGVSILAMLGSADLRGAKLDSLRFVGFGGEVFAVSQLRALRARLPRTRMFNCWGSTETCTGFVHEVGEQIDGPPPIGRPCSHWQARVVDGELQLRGDALMSGYWNRPDLAAEKLEVATDGGGVWYKTGDRVIEHANGELVYAGRIGRMIKLHGYHIEPGEIEAHLYGHVDVREAAVVPKTTEERTVLIAHLSTATNEPLAVVRLKKFCAEKLPPYMIPHAFVFHTALPRTSTGKIDLQTLAALGSA